MFIINYSDKTKDLVLEIYSYLDSLGFKVYLLSKDINIKDRYLYINKFIKDNPLVLEINYAKDNTIIHSINDANSYFEMDEIGLVKTKSLPIDNNKDYYFFNRVLDNYLIFNLNYKKEEVKALSKKIGNCLINYLNTNNYFHYIVEDRNITLKNICDNYLVDFSYIKKINNLNTDMLDIGQVLKIPKQKIYTVELSDSLNSIAKKFGVDINSIKKINHLESDIVLPNQKLIIP